MKFLNILTVFLVVTIIISSITLSESIDNSDNDDSGIEWRNNSHKELNDHQDETSVIIDNKSTLQNILNNGRTLFKKVQNKKNVIKPTSFGDVFVIGKNKLPIEILINSIQVVCKYIINIFYLLIIIHYYSVLRLYIAVYISKIQKIINLNK